MWRQVCFAGMLMVMVIYSALVRSHQSTSLVASASCGCVPRGYTTRAQPCLKMWRGSPDRTSPLGARVAYIPCTLAPEKWTDVDRWVDAYLLVKRVAFALPQFATSASARAWRGSL